MRIIDGTPIDKIEQRFNTFQTEINTVNANTAFNLGSIKIIAKDTENLGKSLNTAIENFEKNISKAEIDLNKEISKKADEVLEKALEAIPIKVAEILNEKFENVDFAQMKADITTLQTAITGFDFAQMKADITTLQTAITGFDFAQIKADIALLKNPPKP